MKFHSSSTPSKKEEKSCQNKFINRIKFFLNVTCEKKVIWCHICQMCDKSRCGKAQSRCGKAQNEIKEWGAIIRSHSISVRRMKKIFFFCDVRRFFFSERERNNFALQDKLLII